MFQVGITPPKAKKVQKRPFVFYGPKRPRAEPESPKKDPKFYIPYSSWLILPESDLTVYDRMIFTIPSTASLANAYTRVIGFRSAHPEKKSIAYAIANVIEPTPYNTIQNALLKTFHANQRLRWLLKRLVLSWKSTRFTTVNDVDIITMETPKQPVYIRDWSQKKIYVFEASSLLKDAIMRLSQHDELFMEPQYPRNLLTNMNFPYSSFMAITDAFRKYGITHWIWEAFVESKYRTTSFLANFEVSLKLYGLNEVLQSGSTHYSREFLIEFILQEYEHHQVTPPSDATLHKVLEKDWNMRSVRLWINLCKEEWGHRIRIHNYTLETIEKIHARTKPLIQANLLSQF
jgi:hypothetical protein